MLCVRMSTGSYTWLHVNVSVARPRGVCECHFVGSDAAVDPLRQKFLSRLALWYAMSHPYVSFDVFSGFCCLLQG